MSSLPAEPPLVFEAQNLLPTLEDEVGSYRVQMEKPKIGLAPVQMRLSLPPAVPSLDSETRRESKDPDRIILLFSLLPGAILAIDWDCHLSGIYLNDSIIDIAHIKNISLRSFVSRINCLTFSPRRAYKNFTVPNKFLLMKEKADARPK